MKETKILHLVPGWRVTNKTLNFFDSFNLIGNHTFGVFFFSNQKIDIATDYNTIKTFFINKQKNKIKNTRNLVKLLKQYDNIIIHSLGIIDNFTMLYLTLFNKKLIKKITWVEFGPDFYVIEQKYSSLKHELWRLFYCYFLNHIPNIVAIFEGDLPFIRERFPNAKTTFIPYAFDDFTELIIPSQRKQQNINILVSHRYRDCVRYEEILKRISKYKSSENYFNIIIPLSGASDNRIQQITSLAHSFFKNIQIYNEKIPENAYNDFLNTIDIAIIDCELKQQVALGTVNRLLIHGKKVFLPKGSSMHNFYRSKGINTFLIETIGEYDFNKFQEPASDSTQIPSYLNDVYNKSKNQQRWNSFFELLISNHSSK